MLIPLNTSLCLIVAGCALPTNSRQSLRVLPHTPAISNRPLLEPSSREFGAKHAFARTQENIFDAPASEVIHRQIRYRSFVHASLKVPKRDRSTQTRVHWLVTEEVIKPPEQRV